MTSNSPTGPRIGVITFPGTLDDVDAARAVRYSGAEAVPLWHAEEDLHGVDDHVSVRPLVAHLDHGLGPRLEPKRAERHEQFGMICDAVDSRPFVHGVADAVLFRREALRIAHIA